MEHPPKQGLKQTSAIPLWGPFASSFNGTSTKTRIETLKAVRNTIHHLGFNGTSTKTRIETLHIVKHTNANISFNGTSTKTRIETQCGVLRPIIKK